MWWRKENVYPPPNNIKKIREPKLHELGVALGLFKVVQFYDNSTFSIGQILVSNIPVINKYIESELRKQASLKNSKHKLSAFVTIEYVVNQDDCVDGKMTKIFNPNGFRYSNNDMINLTSKYNLCNFTNYLVSRFTIHLEKTKKCSLTFAGIKC